VTGAAPCWGAGPEEAGAVLQECPVGKWVPDYRSVSERSVTATGLGVTGAVHLRNALWRMVRLHHICKWMGKCWNYHSENSFENKNENSWYVVKTVRAW